MAAPGTVRRLFVAGLLVASLMVAFSSSITAAMQESPDDSKTVNLELILDASGSMAEEIEPGVTRIEAAREALGSFIDGLPRAESANIGLRVYGHKGANNEAGRAESCLSTELMVPVIGVEADALRAELEAYQPVGWTPLSLALAESEIDFPDASDDHVNATILMTDGLETCGGDPCTTSRQLKNGQKAITTHVIGFALAPDEQEELQCVVDASGGLLLGAGTAGELSEALFLILAELKVVQTAGFLEIEQVGGVFPEATATGGPEPSALNPEPEETSASFTGANVVEVPAGSYTVTWTNPSGEESSIAVVVQVGETTLIRGSAIRLPFGDDEVYVLTGIDGAVVWQDAVGFGDVVWVLPGTYRLEVAEPAADTSLVSMVVQTLPGTVTEVSITTVD